MSQWGGQRSPTTASPDPEKQNENHNVLKRLPNLDTASPQTNQQKVEPYSASPAPRSPATPSRARADSRANTRPNSMIQTYNPPQVELSNDTPPELAPIFSFLNSHSNKLYQEGYFLKLHDLDSRGRPSTDRVWNECFAQLVGTVLSLWDAAALDQAGEDGEVVPTFINLSDASIKMIESLPMNGAQGGSLQNVLSISTAANNRYLLHFNSLNSLTQWTAGIRLAMFEHSTLQEAYTGSLIAGKGRFLNNIKQIMDRSRFAHDDWARVRFGAGTPWKRCWCVVSPPDEKEYQKAQKVLKKGSAYGRAQIPKGDIKFYDTRKITKKTKPIATITDAFAAYAIYPQSKPLIDQSTLVKLEGLVTIHAERETTTEGFVFVMPEVHAAVSGFEMMLRWLFPVFDTFGLYGRPTRLIADTLDQRGLMFAMPRDRRYGYLDILDVSGLIHTEGSQNWSERQWRKEMKKLTSTRMMNVMEDSPRSSRQMSHRRNTTSRSSLPPARGGVQFQEPSVHSTPGSRSGSPAARPGAEPIVRRTDSAPPNALPMSPHKRSASDVYGHRKHRVETPSRLSHEQSRDDDDEPPPPPRHGGMLGANLNDQAAPSPPPEPVLSPPAFQHNPNSRPATQPYAAPELRRQHSNVDQETLNEMRDAVRPAEEDFDNYPPAQSQYGDHGALPYRNQQFAASEPDQRRLSTIPGSPYGNNENEYFHEQAHMPQMDGLVESTGQARPEPPQQLRSSHSIQRKPLPKQLETGQPSSRQQVRSTAEPNSPASPVSATGSLMDFVDSDAIERILNDERTSTLASGSSATPDYESVESSDHEAKKKPKEWVRPGKLKTVGDPEMPAVDSRSGGAGRLDTYNKDLVEQAAEIPTVSFGPTYSYKPTSRPGTSGTMTPGDMNRRSRSRSADKLREGSRSRLSAYFTPSPGESNRNSYFGGRTTPTGIEAGDSPNHRHSIAWPGASPGSQGRASPEVTMNKRKTLSPEEWVQHRAELAAQPQAPQRRSVVPPHLAHQRTASMSAVHTMRQSMSKTPPPFSRSPSGELLQGQNRTPPSRPNSRGAGNYLNQGGLVGNQQSATLSAKEQMYVARASGTPLINMASNPKGQEQVSPGLIGALQAREREKAALSQGMRSNAVQQAIAARQQQQLQMEAEAQAQMQFEMQQRAQQQAQAQMQFEMQQRAQQQAQAQAMAQAQWQQLQQQQVMTNQQHQQPQQRPDNRRNRSWRSSRPQSMHLPMQPQSQAGGYGGQFVQQQGMMPQQQSMPFGGMPQQGAPYGGMPQQGGQRWQQPARR